LGEYFWIFIIVLMVLAAFLGQGGRIVLPLIYLIFGAYVVGGFWSKKAISAIQIKREFTRYAFIGEVLTVRINIENSSLLPILWLRLRESLPVEVSLPGGLNQVVTLPPRGKISFDYSIHCRKRGVYQIGPLDLTSGDLLGFSTQQRSFPAEAIIVFPRILPIKKISFPSNSPLGSLRHTQPIFEDPSRVLAKRDYVVGDSFRRIDWKTSAAMNRLQVNMYEPSIDLEVVIFINLHRQEFNPRSRIDDSELAIVLAASIANYLTRIRQSVGLFTNGECQDDVVALNAGVPARKGRNHLLLILRTLASIQLAESISFTQLLHKQLPHLPWGTSLVIITNQVDDLFFEHLSQAKSAGLKPLLLLCGVIPHISQATSAAIKSGLPYVHIQDEREVDRWLKKTTR
jgi:uncharacterized protein (DUF58 family)